MKKKLLIGLVVVCLFSIYGFSGTAEFSKGSIFITPQVALYSWATNFGVSLEYGMTENIGIGGTVMMAFWSENLGLWGKVSETMITPSIDAYYHFTSIDVEKLDLYAGLSLGYSIYSWSWDTPGMDWTDAGASELYLSPFLGARYFLTKKLAINLKFIYSALGDWGGAGGVIGLTIRTR